MGWNPVKAAKGTLKNVGQALGFVSADTEDVDTSQATQALDTASSKVKSVEQLTQEGAQVAGNTAANAGVLAGDQARTAMANSGGGKLARALVANQAAQEASQNAYNQNLQSSTNLAASQNQAEVDTLAQKANIAANAAQANAQAANQAEQNRISNSIVPQLVGTAANAYLTSKFGKKEGDD